jgi:hypothetical protein
LFDDRVGCIENVLGRAVVLIQDDLLTVRETSIELKDVPNISAAKPVDGLVSVTDHGYVAMFTSEQLDQLVLRRVGVLIFVHEHVLKTRAVVRQHLGFGTEKLDAHQQQVIEIHGARSKQSSLVLGVHFGDSAFVNVGRSGCVRLNIEQVIFCR